jgi:signal transduction histidine kinase
VAHDFDNVLMGLLGFAELALAQIEAGSRPAGFLKELLLVVDNARAITTQMHAFRHSDETGGLPTRLADVCGPAGTGLLGVESPGVRIESSLPANLPPVAVGLAPLLAIVGHLVQNAVEAMPAGGRVTVSARVVSLADGLPNCLPAALDAGEFVELTVSDTGPGLAPGLADRVGREPFLTTKPRHRGLGLPTVLRAVGAHGGGLRIESTSRGTAIIVYLPSASSFSPASTRHVDAAPLEVSPQ